MGVPGNANALLLRSAAAAGGYQVSRSLRFNSSDSVFCSRAVSTTSTRKIFTISAWVKRSRFSTGGFQAIYNADTFKTDFFGFNTSTDQIRVFISGADNGDVSTAAVFRDPSAWYHILFSIDTTQVTPSNRIRVYVNGTEQTLSGTFPVQDYVFTKLFNTAYTQYIGRCAGDYGDFYLAEYFCIDGQALTPSSFTEVSATTGQLIPKAYTGSFGTNGFWLPFSDNSAATATALGKDYSGNGNNWTPNNFSVTGTVNHVTSGLSYRKGARFSSWDTSSADTTPSSSVAADNYWWVDLGSSKTINKIAFDATITGTGSADFYFLYSTSSSSSGSSGCPAGCTITATRSIAGAAPNHHVVFTGFGSITGRYIGISNGTAGSSPTTFSNLRVLDDQGKDNDSLVDTPTSGSQVDTGLGGQVTGNYATLNPLATGFGSNNQAGTLANGNLDWSTASTTYFANAVSTIAPKTGKYYVETICQNASYSGIGFVNAASISGITGNYGLGAPSDGWFRQGTVVNNNTSNAVTGMTALAVGDIVGLALDLDNGKAWWSKNGAWHNSGDPASGTNATVTFTPGGKDWLIGLSLISPASAQSINFGQRPFAYTAPSGFKCLCDTSLPSPVVAKPSTVMDVKLYTGNGSTQTISGLGFSPDLVWIKKRNSGGYGGHYLTDIVRGGGAIISTNATSSETSYDSTWKSLYGQLSAFTNDGFTVVDGSSSVDDEFNGSSGTYVAWTWDAGTSTVTNTQGSITSQVRANASAGFSIVSYTSVGTSTSLDTIGHGLNVSPSIAFIKNRDLSDSWWVYSSLFSDPTKDYLVLNSTSAKGTFGSTTYSASSTTIGIRQGLVASSAGQKIIVYAFSPVVGYSNAFSFVGNGSTDGPAVWLGFRPRFVILKASSSTSHWHMMDSARQTYNQMNTNLFANLSNAELSDPDFQIDFLSNGFKLRTSGPSMNGSGVTYIGYAWAESPFQFSRAR